MSNTISITMKAAIGRVNRKLAHEDEKLCTARSARAQMDLGYHFIVDTTNNFVSTTHVDPEALGRELGVIREWEVVAP